MDKKEEREIRELKKNIRILKRKLIEKVPHHFGYKDMINAFFGALIIGMTFMFKGALVRTVQVLNPANIAIIILVTIGLLVAEIYFMGYTKVKRKSQRHFGQFMTKRLVSLYFISLIVSFGLVYLFGLNILTGSSIETFKTVIVLAFPCAVGAAIPSLLKPYY